LPIWWDGSPPTPVDVWQPEAITLLCLYLSPLFCFSLLLQVGIVLCLFLADRRADYRYALLAGLQGFLLGLVHTYDIITMAAIWAVYLILTLLHPTRNRPEGRSNRLAVLGHALVAGLLTLPAVVYIAYQLRHESVFRARANVPTLAPSLTWVLI